MTVTTEEAIQYFERLSAKAEQYAVDFERFFPGYKSNQWRVKALFDIATAALRAQQAAEKEDNPNFTCPLCGGDAWWGRAECNHHLHCGCRKCGFRIAE